MTDPRERLIDEARGPVGRVLGFFLHNPMLVAVLAAAVLAGGYAVAPFPWDWRPAGAVPVPVDTLPNLGDNQQVVFTEWPGQSPEDVEDQVTYPLTTTLLGMKGVKAVRSSSMFGFSSIYVIFEDGMDFYDARALVNEKLQSLKRESFPEGITPRLGPEATGLGQVFWYTLEGRDERGRPVGGWDLQELRSIQDWTVRYGLAAVSGVSEVASVGGYVREFQIELDREAMTQYGVSIRQVYDAVAGSNTDIGAKTIELNKVEYFVRGIGFITSTDQLAQCVVKIVDGTPIFLSQIATVQTGPAQRRGILDKDGAEAVGGVVTVRVDANALTTIERVKRAVDEMAPNLDRKAVIDYDRAAEAGVDDAAIAAFAHGEGFEPRDDDGTLNQAGWLAYIDRTPIDERPDWLASSRVTLVPYYDRTGLIEETLVTLADALRSQMLITFIVIILMMVHLRSSIIIGTLLPLAVAMTFIVMKVAGIDANIVSLAGIAIAIGTIVDMGIVLCDNILHHLAEDAELGVADSPGARLTSIHNASAEVGSAVLTAVMTTIVGFLPVFALTGKAGRMFRPLAFTKTFALASSILIALLVLPTLACWLLRRPRRRSKTAAGWPWRRIGRIALYVATLALVVYLLVAAWMPAGRNHSLALNLLFTVTLIGLLIAAFKVFQYFYPRILRWALDHKKTFLAVPALLVVAAGLAWLGAEKLLGPLARVTRLDRTQLWTDATTLFPGTGREFMPEFDEGSFLWMPTISINGSVSEALDYLSKQDMALRSIPEIETVVGKAGRTDSPLDPAPLSMIETVVTYKSEYRMEDGKLIRQWRDSIQSPDDIWDEMVRVARIPGSTSASKGYPIQIRQVMLQTGMTANMGIKIFGDDLGRLSRAADAIGRLLADAPGVLADSINVDRVTGKPYLVFDTSDEQVRARMRLYGLNGGDILTAMRDTIGGRVVSTTVDGRERIDIRIRYQRELRDTIEAINAIRVRAADGRMIPLENIGAFSYVRGPQVVRGENSFKVAYVTFDTEASLAEVEAAAGVKNYLERCIADGRLTLPETVTSWKVTGAYENEAEANATLRVVVPLALATIFIILYFQFRSVVTTGLIFSGIAVAFSGGFLLIWLYGQSWFLGGRIGPLSLREIFQVAPVNLSTAVWVGFLALFGIATDDGVVMGAYLTQVFARKDPASIHECREMAVQAGSRRVRACLMTTATTILALLPVLSSTGRGADIMIPMAIPSFGGMAIEILTMLVVPVLYCGVQEWKYRKSNPKIKM